LIEADYKATVAVPSEKMGGAIQPREFCMRRGTIFAVADFDFVAAAYFSGGRR